MKWVLIVTWFIAGQAPVPLQVEFNSNETCSKAAANVAVEFARKHARGEVFLTCVER